MKENSVIRTHVDYPLLICTILLVGIGLTMVYSASAVLATEKFGEGYFYIKRMLCYAVVGFGLLAFALHFSYERWKQFALPILFFSVLLMFCVLMTGLGVSVSGARRWLALGPFRFQPSELAKFAMVLFVAFSLSKKSFSQIQKFSTGVLPYLIVGGVVILLVFAEKDLGAAMVIALLMGLLIFLSGTRIFYLVCLGVSMVPLLYWVVVQESYRLRRILSFLNPWEDRFGSGFQIIQSYLAFSEGGLFGKGLGAGQQKLFYLPEAHTDFIFSVLGEELGLLGVLITLSLFAFFILRGFQIAAKAPDFFGKYLAMGLTLLIGVQAVLNIGVVMGLLPTKGLVLPFISYGGSSLLMSLLAVGVLLNISTYQQLEEGNSNDENFTGVRRNRWTHFSGNGSGRGIGK